MNRRNVLIALAAIFAVALIVPGAAGADGTPDPQWETSLGVGTDDAGSQTCLGCHSAVQGSWSNLSTHSLILDCATCHVATNPPGPGHAAKAACETCHSEQTHPTGAACTSCHDPHGSANAFLVRADLPLTAGGTAAVHFTRPEGASKDGLVRQGVSGATAGTGVCEVCHSKTAHYDQKGSGTAHSGDWCALCHSHQGGFQAP